MHTITKDDINPRIQTILVSDTREVKGYTGVISQYKKIICYHNIETGNTKYGVEAQFQPEPSSNSWDTFNIAYENLETAITKYNSLQF